MKEFAKSLGKVAKSAGDAAARTLRTKVEEAQDQERPGDLGGLAACAGTSAGELPDSVTVMVGCWNVFASAISDDDGLDEWLLAGGACGPPDVLALGFQEVIDLHPANCVLKMGGDYEREDLIDAKLTSYLQKHGKYVKARSGGAVADTWSAS
ncbi:unnamed protein product [Prorocentrum cordatum]|uniref:Inositol-polyphosphate 5-phosphatase n=1 Tax=Prorocentrum cordatum TaxID=2364126 RepID=A0ABN9UQR2_9DINO|nr:unnamed protein product [Polarella glacialis]